MALTLAVGFVVDDAIVMLENIVRHMEMGKRPMQAALDGAREIGFTILSMTCRWSAVFIPVCSWAGCSGAVHEFAVAIGVAILVSGFVSLTLTPMMCSRFLVSERDKPHGRAHQATDRAFQRALRFYQRTLEWVMHHRRGRPGVLAGDPARYGRGCSCSCPRASSQRGHRSDHRHHRDRRGHVVHAMVRHQQQVAAIILKDPNVAGFMSSVGGGGGGGSINQGRTQPPAQAAQRSGS
jgi:HAE1 family hydrophobic/amphiphilic exporter-1